MKKYLCIAGRVFGGGSQIVPAVRLPDLYRVPRGECVFADDDEEAERRMAGYRGKITVLRPRSSGRYDVIPEPEDWVR